MPFLTAFFGLMLVGGCNRASSPAFPTIKISGSVKVDGVPVEQGRIRFSPTQPNQATAAECLVAAGLYSVERAPVGDVVVTFNGIKKTGRTVELYGRKSDETVNIIPAKYSRGVPANIKESGTRDFDLTSR